MLVLRFEREDRDAIAYGHGDGDREQTRAAEVYHHIGFAIEYECCRPPLLVESICLVDGVRGKYQCVQDDPDDGCPVTDMLVLVQAHASFADLFKQETPPKRHDLRKKIFPQLYSVGHPSRCFSHFARFNIFIWCVSFSIIPIVSKSSMQLFTNIPKYWGDFTVFIGYVLKIYIYWLRAQQKAV